MTANSIRLPILMWILTVERCVHSCNIPIYGQRQLDPHTIEHQERRFAAAHSRLCLSYQNHHWSLCPVFASYPAVNSVKHNGDPSDETTILQRLLHTTYNQLQDIQSGINLNYNPNLVQQSLNKVHLMTNNLQNSLDYNLLQRLQNPLDNRMNNKGFLGQASINYNPWESSYDEIQFPIKDIDRAAQSKHKIDFVPKLHTWNYSSENKLTTKTFNRKTRETATTFAPIINSVSSVTRPMMVQNIPNINMIQRKYDTSGKLVLNPMIIKYAVTTVPIDLLRVHSEIPKILDKNDNVSKRVGIILKKTDELYKTNHMTTLEPTKTSDAGTSPDCVITKTNDATSMKSLNFSETSEMASHGTESFLTVPSSPSIPELDVVTFSSTDQTITELPRLVTKTLQVDGTQRTSVPFPIVRIYKQNSPDVVDKIIQTLDQFERKFYTTTFTKLSSISPADRRENGISFVESGLFLYMILTAFSMEVDPKTRTEIEDKLALPASDTDKLDIVQWTVNMLPKSSDTLKFRWSSRLVVNGTFALATKAAETLRLHLDNFNSNETSDKVMKYLNHLVEIDSGGAMRDTFEEDEISDGVRAALLSTVYVRARWRASPTLLNGTRIFCDAEGAPVRTARMIRINDIVHYADLTEWDAEAVEIPYSTPGLSLLVLVPRGRSLRALSGYMSTAGLHTVFSKMRSMRVATTLPIYTLRMTLLLPNKLQAMGISRLLDIHNGTTPTDLRISHAVQRLMFWAEAGRNAYKDDGIEWDDPPQLELVVDRPYIFFVRWQNLTIMNGNFVL